MMIPRDSAGNEIQIPEKMAISLKGKRALYKNDLMMLEMISNANWTRPLYVALTVGAENFMNLGDNFIQEGLVNRITPFATNEQTNFDTEKTYNNVMNKFKFGGLEKKGLYLDETVMRMCFTHRRLFGMLITHLLQEGKTDKAKKVLAYAEKVLPTYNVPMTYLSGGMDFLQGYYAVGDKKKAEEVLNDMWKNSQQYLSWYLSLNDKRFGQSQRECLLHFYTMQRILEISSRYDEALTMKKDNELKSLMTVYHNRGGNFGE